MGSLPVRFSLTGVLTLAALAALVITANILSDFIAQQLKFELRPSNEDAVHRMIMLSALAYGVLIAIPFVPGVEIGFGLIAMLGPQIVLLVYVTTILGLSLSFAAGRFIPPDMLARGLRGLGAGSASRLVLDFAATPRQEKLSFLIARAPNRALPFLLKSRYIALAVAINLPGNFLIGGGGGISLVAGASRLFSFPAFVLAIAFAVAPVPLGIVLFGVLP